MERPDSRTDDELLAAARRDPDAFAAFYARHAHGVFAYFMSRTRRAELAADLTAEVFASALAGVERYRGGSGSAAPWLYGIAHNKLIDTVRRGRVEDGARRRLGMRPVELADDELDRVEDLLDLKAEEERLAALLASLPADQRDAITAHVLDGRRYEEIAAQLGCSAAVVRKRVSRGLGRLRAGLSEDG